MWHAHILLGCLIMLTCIAMYGCAGTIKEPGNPQRIHQVMQAVPRGGHSIVDYTKFLNAGDEVRGNIMVTEAQVEFLDWATPWTFEADLRLDKGFNLFGADAQIFMYVQNLFDKQNVINVYSRTGNDKDDGFLTNPDMSSQIIEASGGLTYTQLYQAINLVNRQHYWYNQTGDIYGEPRQIRFGLKFSL